MDEDPGDMGEDVDDVEGRDRSGDLLAEELTPATLRAIGLRADALAAEIRGVRAMIESVDPLLPKYFQAIFRARLDTAVQDIGEAGYALERTAADLARARTARAKG